MKDGSRMADIRPPRKGPHGTSIPGGSWNSLGTKSDKTLVLMEGTF